MRKALVVEGIQKKCSLPISALVLEYRHVWYDDLHRSCCVPVPIYNIWKLNMFLSLFLVDVFSGFWPDSGLFTAFMCQIMRKYPSCLFKHIICKSVVAMGGMLLVFLMSAVICPFHNGSVFPDVFSIYNIPTYLPPWVGTERLLDISLLILRWFHILVLSCNEYLAWHWWAGWILKQKDHTTGL